VRPKKSALAAILFIFLISNGFPIYAKDPITVTDASGTSAFSGNGLIDFFNNNYQPNPRTATLNVLGNLFTFDTGGKTGSQVTSIRFVSQDLGIDQTFTGPDSTSATNALKNFLTSNAFLSQFIKLVNTGPGAQVTGTPTGAVNKTAAIAQQQLSQQSMTTSDEKAGQQLAGVELAAGFTTFDANGFQGKSTGGSPGYSWKLGDHQDRRFNFTMPVAVISVEGLQTYRVGTIFQYVHPFYLTPRLTLRVGPDVSYTVIGSLDLPNISGTIGGAMTNTLTQDWDKYVLTFGGYYGRFQNLGGIPTGIQANIGAYGLQGGRRIGQRSILSLFAEDTLNNVIGQPIVVYHVLGTAFSHRLLGRWNLTLGVDETLGIPGYTATEFTASSQWKF